MASCDAPGLMPISEAKTIIHSMLTRVTEIELCNLEGLLDRVLAEDVISPINVPAYDNSAMDGYGFSHASSEQSNRFTIIGKSFAGNAFQGTVAAGECVRIMTGAEIPSGVDTVIMQEATTQSDSIMTISSEVQAGANIRKAGGDIMKGTSVLKQGHRIGAVDIGLLASLGINKLRVYRKVTVAVFSTGDELLAAGEAAREDRIFDSNRPMVIAMLRKLGVEVVDLGIVQDNKTAIRSAFEKANELADCVITSGGVSVGEADYTREVLDEYGSIDFWKLAIKPGKPLAFGRLPNSYFFGLPGNPVSSAVTFDQIAKEAILHIAGCNTKQPTLFAAIAATRFKKRPGRTDYQRVAYFKNDDGELCVKHVGTQSSGVLSSFSRSNCYAVLEQERGTVEIGETVSILPFDSSIRSL
ncbi:molybdopterin molybdotransferase MoeA [Glaciecola sp. MH2013]|uniref:molybdopterin molybdotransferase MoeA n=1 Tax=Glaciecola sp. MH2013 TaxID=2785524 RepID=UPI00189E0423|nr:gephyrin-like molybdotransferase Glp [Glaciecola sp. MH2013]MBF7074508.1 molybdopterin molybdotransferase MoeA [Glaciecola sp. MH2013]